MRAEVVKETKRGLTSASKHRGVFNCILHGGEQRAVQNIDNEY